MNTLAMTKSGKFVRIDEVTPVCEGDKVVGYRSYTYSNEWYPVPSGAVAYYATQVFIPN